MKKARPVIVAAVFVSLLSIEGVEPARAQSSAGRPDFSGIWFPRGFGRRSPNPLPLTEAAQALLEDFDSQFTAADDDGKYCIWPGMPRVIWGAPFAIEIIHRERDITIYWEGYGMYRKIYMRDQNPPEPILPTAMGHSLAHWEGDTLVVETTHLRPYPIMNGLPTTSNAHVVERMRLEDREIEGEMQTTLVNDVVLTDPQMYTEPVTIVGEITLRPDLHILEYTCSTTLWEEYLDERGLTLPDVDALP